MQIQVSELRQLRTLACMTSADGVRPATALLRAPINAQFTSLTVECLQQTRQLAARALDGFTELGPQSVVAADHAAVDEMPEEFREVRHNLIATGFSGAEGAAVNALDHFEALEHDVARIPAPVWSPLSLTRVALEGFTLACYLLDTTLSTEQRLARIAGLWATEADNSLKAARTFGADEEAHAQRNRAFVSEELAKGGIREEKAGNRLIKVWVEETWATPDVNLTEESTRLMPDGMPSPYRLTSGTAHCRPWMLERSASVDQSAALGYSGEMATVMTAVSVVAFSARHWAAMRAAYLGVDISPTLQEMNDLHGAYLQRILEARRTQK